MGLIRPIKTKRIFLFNCSISLSYTSIYSFIQTLAMSAPAKRKKPAADDPCCWVVTVLRTSDCHKRGGQFLTPSSIRVLADEESANEYRKDVLLEWLYDRVDSLIDEDDDGPDNIDLWELVKDEGWRLRDETDIFDALKEYIEGEFYPTLIEVEVHKKRIKGWTKNAAAKCAKTV